MIEENARMKVCNEDYYTRKFCILPRISRKEPGTVNPLILASNPSLSCHGNLSAACVLWEGPPRKRHRKSEKAQSKRITTVESRA